MEDRVHLLSPAKMFAYMKERENRPEQHEGRKLAGTRNLFGCNRGTFGKSSQLKKNNTFGLSPQKKL